MRPDKAIAVTAGVPTWLRRYNVRYGQKRPYGRGIEGLLKCHKQCVAPMLDHGLARKAKRLVAAALAPREIITGIA